MRRVTISLVAVGLCAGMASAKDAPLPDAYESLEVRPLTRSTTDIYDVLAQLLQARSDYTGRQFDRSYRAYRYVALHDRNNVEAALGTANSALEIGKAKEALAIFTNLAAADLKPEDKHAVASGLILAQYLTSELGDPESELIKALELAPTDFRLWNALGDSYKNTHQWQDATRAYEEAHRTGFPKAGLYNNFGLMLMAQKNHTGAVRYFEQAVKLDASNLSFEHNYRMALVLDGQYEAAMTALTDRRAAKLLTQSGKLAIESDNPDLARILLAKAIDISPVYNVEAEVSLSALN